MKIRKEKDSDDEGQGGEEVCDMPAADLPLAYDEARFP